MLFLCNGTRAAGCNPSLAHLPMTHSLATHPLFTTHPCHAPPLARILHAFKNLAFLNPLLGFYIGDWTALHYHTASFCILVGALLFPRCAMRSNLK